MPYQPKFKIGETVEVARDLKNEGISYRFGCTPIIIGAWHQILPYSFSLNDDERYNGNDSEHTLYATYNPLGVPFWWWYWESDLELYCRNQERGMDALKNIRFEIASQYNFNTNALNSYIEKYFRETSSVEGALPPPPLDKPLVV